MALVSPVFPPLVADSAVFEKFAHFGRSFGIPFFPLHFAFGFRNAFATLKQKGRVLCPLPHSQRAYVRHAHSRAQLLTPNNRRYKTASKESHLRTNTHAAREPAEPTEPTERGERGARNGTAKRGERSEERIVSVTLMKKNVPSFRAMNAHRPRAAVCVFIYPSSERANRRTKKINCVAASLII